MNYEVKYRYKLRGRRYEVKIIITIYHFILKTS